MSCYSFLVHRLQVPNRRALLTLTAPRFLSVISLLTSLSAIPAHAQSPSFFSREAINPLVNPYGVAVADINGDGVQDIVTFSGAESSLIWSLGQVTTTTIGVTSLSFSPPQYVITSTSATTNEILVQIADFDGVNGLDVLVAVRQSDYLAWFPNDGTATPAFATEHILSLDPDGAGASQGLVDGPIAVVPIDVDGDTDPDVVFAARDQSTGTPGQLGWIENIGGVLSGAPTFLGGDHRNNGPLTIGDFGGDALPDILVFQGAGSSFDKGLFLYINDSAEASHFETPSSILMALDHAEGLASMDVNADGRLDLVVTKLDSAPGVRLLTQDSVTPLLFSTQIVTSENTESVAFGDWNGDNTIDLATRTEKGVGLHMNDGGSIPAFITEVVETGTHVRIREIHAADIDGDGDIDLTTASGASDTIRVHENDLNPALDIDTMTRYGTITDALQAVSAPFRLAVNGGQFSQESNIDAASAGAGQIQSTRDATIAAGATVVLFEDSELFTAPGFDFTVNGSVQVEGSPANSGITRLGASDTGPPSGSVLFGGDASLHIEPNAASVIVNSEVVALGGDVTIGESGALQIDAATVLGGTPPVIANERVLNIGTSSQVGLMTAADFDSDGDQDPLYFQGSPLSELVLVENTGPFQGAPTSIYVGAQSMAVALAVADFNGDSQPDIVAADQSGVFYLENDGSNFATATPQVLSTLSTFTSFDDARIVVIDVEQDGWMDFIYASSKESANWLFRNDLSESGLFIRENLPGTSARTGSLLAIDLDNDADDDVVYLDTLRFQWLRNDAGTFQSPQILSGIVFFSPNDLEATDFDSDGDIDLVAARDGSVLAVVYFENSGGASPTLSPIDYSFPETVQKGGLRDIDVIDLDQDGDEDLYLGIAPGEVSTLYFLENIDGTVGSMTISTIDEYSLSQVQQIEPVDYDGDGDLDLLAYFQDIFGSSDPDRLVVHETEGLAGGASNTALASGATFVINGDLQVEPRSSISVAADAPGQAAPFVLGPGTAALLDGSLSFSLPPGANPAVGEVFPILESPIILGQLKSAVLPGLGNGKVLVARIIDQGARATQQLVVEVQSLNVRDTDFDLAQDTPVVGEPSAAVSDEFNGDGVADIAVAIPDTGGGSGSVVFLFGDGATPGQFSSSLQIFNVGVDPSGVNSSDVDGNTTRDVVVVNRNDASGAVLLGDGLGNFVLSASTVPTGVGSTDVAIVDVNDDGSDDLVITNEVSNSIQIRINDGSGIFSGTNEVRFGSGRKPKRICPADISNTPLPAPPPHPDLLIALTGAPGETGTLAVIPAKSSAPWFGAPVELPAGVDPSNVGEADLNGDGLLDVVVVNSGAVTLADGSVVGELSVFLNTGDPVVAPFEPAVQLPVGDAPRSLALLDFDVDGDTDIATIVESPGVVRILRNDGSGSASASSFSSTTDVVSDTEPLLVLGTDLDGDGDDDLVAIGVETSARAAGDGVVSAHINRDLILGDLDGNGSVGGADLAILLAAWGGADALADIDEDGIVNGADLAILLANWT